MNIIALKLWKLWNEIIQVEMDKISDWLNVNKLSINTAKTKMTFSDQETKNPNMI